MIFCIVVILGGRNEWMEKLNASPCKQFHHRFSFLLPQPEITLALALWNIVLYVTSCHDLMFAVVRLDVFCWDAEALTLCYRGRLVWFWNKHSVQFSFCFTMEWSKTLSTFSHCLWLISSFSSLPVTISLSLPPFCNLCDQITSSCHLSRA